MNRANSISFWSTLPVRVRWSLLPLFTTALLVGAGEESARLIAAIFTGKTGDIVALLLLANLVLALWVFKHVLELEIREAGGIPDPASRLLNFASIFVTVLDLLKIVVSQGLESYVTLFLPVVLFYLLVVPFALIRIATIQDVQKQTEPNQLLIFLLRVSARFTFGATFLAVVVAFVVGLFFVFINDGITIGSFSTLKPIQEFLTHDHRVEFWMVNPMLLGVVSLQLFCFRVGHPTSLDVAGIESGFTKFGSFIFLSVSVGLVALMSALMLNAKDLHGGDTVLVNFVQESSDLRISIQILVGVAYAVFFVVAAFRSENISVGGRAGEAMKIAIFAVSGAIVGLLLFLTRLVTSVDVGPRHLSLVILHAISFVLAYCGASLAQRVLVTPKSIGIPGIFRSSDFNVTIAVMCSILVLALLTAVSAGIGSR